MEKTELVKAICKAASDKKAESILSMDIHDMTVITDFFVVCSAQSKTQVRAICDHIEEEMRKAGVNALKIDGYQEARWIIMDFDDVLVHIFTEEDRAFYSLERLWNNGNNTRLYSGD